MKQILEDKWLGVAPDQYGDYIPGIIEALLEEIEDLEQEIKRLKK